MRVTVKRLKKSYENETVSEIYIDDSFFCYGMEQPWNDNISFKSCIPKGVYNLENFNSSKYGKTYCFYNPYLGVTEYEDKDNTYLGYNRFACLIHSANWAHQLQGCLALGKECLDYNDKHMITSSRDTVRLFFKKIDEFLENNEPEDVMFEFLNEGDFE